MAPENGSDAPPPEVMVAFAGGPPLPMTACWAALDAAWAEVGYWRALWVAQQAAPPAMLTPETALPYARRENNP